MCVHKCELYQISLQETSFLVVTTKTEDKRAYMYLSSPGIPKGYVTGSMAYRIHRQ